MLGSVLSDFLYEDQTRSKFGAIKCKRRESVEKSSFEGERLSKPLNSLDKKNSTIFVVEKSGHTIIFGPNKT